LREWAENCPPTFGDKYALVSAELARIEGRELDALRLYEEAIQAARANGFVQNEGVAHELVAQFYLKCGIEKVAHSYLRDARDCFLRWGAPGKAKQLGERYPATEEQASVRSTSTIGASVEQLDLEIILKASHAVSGEIVLENLIETLLVTVVEHAGAERGLLILPHGEELRIAAEARTSGDRVELELQDASVTISDLPDGLLHYVIRTQESVILDDALTQNQFAQAEYVREQRPRSVLCMPLVKQTKLMGVLYLENKLATQVFTPKRVAILEMLSSQAAISLDHARLYADLGRLNVALRTSEERLQDIIDNTTAVIFVKDLDLHYLLVNREFERRHQVQRDQFRGKTDYDIHPSDVAEAVRANDRQVMEAGVPIQFEETVPSAKGERSHVSLKFLLRDRSGEPYAICGIATDITESKRAEAMQATIALERELLAQQRASELAKANEALRGCLDALASVPELDDFLGQVMVAITRQLGAVSSTLRVRSFEQNTLTLEFVFQDGRVMTPDEANYPECWRSVSLEQFDPDYLCHSTLTRTKGEQRVATLLNRPTAIIRILDPHSPMPDDQRSYLRELGVRTVLIIPLTARGQANGRLTFRFTEERDFHPEELEIARALATQASLAIHLTRLAKTASQSAVLEERNQLAGEIHDSLGQLFTGISMQLGVAQEAFKTGDGLSYVERAAELAQFGLEEARRSAFSLQETVIEGSGLIDALQRLVERSNVPGRLHCGFRSRGVPEESLPARIQHELLRISQEAISNAVRHAEPTMISVTLSWEPPNLILKVKDNGSGISSANLEKSEGLGLRQMRTRASQIDGILNIQSAVGHGTSIVLTVPIPSQNRQRQK
jgi:PAS domain S-box-containing protein